MVVVGCLLQAAAVNGMLAKVANYGVIWQGSLGFSSTNWHSVERESGVAGANSDRWLKRS